MISRALVLDVFAKSFFIQAAWNAERMQNVGFLFSVRRSLKSIWKNNPAGFEAACGRASAFFNTHPYFAPAVMGVALHLEEKIAAGKASLEDLDSVKANISAPLNALGSLWFWDHLKLLAFLVALPLLILRDPEAIAAGVVLFFALFNFYHLRTRWVGLHLGLLHGENMVPTILAMFPSRLLQSFRRISTFLLGMTTPLMLAVLFERLQNRLPNLMDSIYIPDLFFTRLTLGLLLTGAAIVVMHYRWLSVYQLLALAMGLAVGAARWA